MNYAGLTIFTLLCLVFYVALPMYESRIWRKQKEAEIAQLRQVIQHTIAMLDNADLESGVCCCGDSMQGHSDPMACGHSPVDSGAYYVEQHVRYLRSVLSGEAQKDTS